MAPRALIEMRNYVTERALSIERKNSVASLQYAQSGIPS
jgi:hypothetical protein